MYNHWRVARRLPLMQQQIWDAAIFLLVSTLEWFGLFVLIFAMFKLPFSGYWGQIAVNAFMLSFVSYTVFMALDLRLYATAIQGVILLLCLWQNIRIHPFYAAIISMNGILVYASFQSLLFVFWKSFMDTPIEPGEWGAYLLQLTTTIVILAVARIVHVKRIGFTFVPDTEFIDVKWNKINTTLFILTLFAYAVEIVSPLLLFTQDYINVLLLFVITVFSLTILQLWIIKKEFNQHDD
ncbi:MAG: hypothetical protein BLM47_13360 [Candidatus Reconcilbacillus cellulovorans]|uniref:Uncharacterized protein n=1 Tax=Candidatus Reconcilbacillus cellulovorans TaxID=1906605 RepID=A0A2A6DX33_9BACL|nr:MAG: hypothetical protein BLM47_13360 [Candidatus Reconcilbacillus cellulovorans]